jgi:hypothetical protein
MRRQQFDDSMRFHLTRDMKVDLWDAAGRMGMPASDLVRRVIETWLKGDRKLIIGGKGSAKS